MAPSPSRSTWLKSSVPTRSSTARFPPSTASAKDIKFSAGESQVVVRLDPRDVPKKGETIWVTIRTGEQHVFSSASGLRLSSEPVITTKK